MTRTKLVAEIGKTDIAWTNSRNCWRFSKYEIMTSKLSPYKRLAKDKGDAAYVLFKRMKHIKNKGE